MWKRRLFYTLLLLVALSVGAVVSCMIWMRGGEEAALDYSIMDYDVGVVDSECNGYTYMRLFSEVHSSDVPDDFFDEDYFLRVNWDQTLFREMVEVNRGYIDDFAKAFDRDIFQFDQPARPETLNPEVADLRDYVRLRMIEVRLLQMDGADQLAFEHLLKIRNEVLVYAQGGGCLIHLLISIACLDIIDAELDELQNSGELPSAVWLAGSEALADADSSALIRSAFMGEFHFFKYCIEVIRDEPSEISWLMGAGADGRSGFVYDLAFGSFFKPTRTTNDIFRIYSEILHQSELSVKDRTIPPMPFALDEGELDKLDAFLSRNATGVILLAILLPASEVILDRVAMADTMVRCRQINLALQAYYLDTGKLPDELELLIPKYLPQIPADPFDGQSLRYSRKQQIVYSVGNDFIDANGSKLPFRHEGSGGDFAEMDESEPTYLLHFVD